VLRITAGGLVTSVGTNAATATVTAAYLGKNSSRDVQVIPLPPAVLAHRYSFATNADDSIGNANGQLVGDATISQGAVVLSGNKPGYVNLPNDLFTNLASATLEIWFTWSGGPAWQRIWDFGNSSAGEDTQGAASASIFLTPDNGGGMQWSIFPNTSVFGQQVLNAAAPGKNQLHHLVWTYDDLATTGVLYLDGAQVAINRNLTSKPSDLGPTANNWLGHSQYVQDAEFSGSIAEFRIYSGTLTAAQVTNDFAVGPNPSGRGALLSITLEARPTLLPHVGQQLVVKGDFENVAGVDLTADPGVVYDVTDSAVLSVSPSGWLVSVGSTDAAASVRATYQGKTSSRSVHVIPPPVPVLIHRYSFSSNATDSVGPADGTLVGDAAINGGAVILSGHKPSYVDLPNTLVDTLTDVTFELWVTWDGAGIWERIFDFGNNTVGEDMQGAATQSIFLTPNNGGVMDLSIFPQGIGGQQVINGIPLAAHVQHHVVWAYSVATTTSRLFVDGVENGSNNSMTYTLADLAPMSNVWLGHSQYIQDADFAGAIAEFRIYRGTFLDTDVAAGFAAGPDTLPAETASRRLAVSFSSGKITLSWPVTTTGFILETSATLGAGGDWTQVMVDASNTVTVNTTGEGAFYRLRKLP
jgi:hypothetical protein